MGKDKKPETKKPKSKVPDLVKNKAPYLDDLTACMQCGYCQSVCPVYEEGKWESLSPRGKLFLMKDLTSKNSALQRLFGKKITNKITGSVEIDHEEFMNAIYRCTLCSRCETVCHVEIEFHEYWDHLREWMVKNGIKPPENTINMYNDIANTDFNNPFKETKDKRDEWYRDDYPDLPATAEVVYYIGCMTSFYEYQVLLNTMKIFTKAGVNFTTLGQEEVCCSAINVMTGQTENFKDIAKRNVDAIKKRGAKRVVTGCPGCFRALRKYKKFVDYDFEIIHTIDLLHEVVTQGKLEWKKDFKSKQLPVIYHDPCELGRILEFEDKPRYDQPREILLAVPGIDEVLEFPTNKLDSACCGGGGGLKATDYDLSSQIALKKVEAAIEIGAKTIVSTCPNCKNQIGIAVELKKAELKKQGEKFKMNVMDVTDVVSKSI